MRFHVYLPSILFSVHAAYGEVSALTQSASKRASRRSVTLPYNCPEGQKFLHQLVDHSTIDHSQPNATGADIWKQKYSGSNATFLQQYVLNDTFYRPGGPILFFQGNEEPLPCLADTAIPEHAKQLGAMMVSLEHRYWGSSCPFGLNCSDFPSRTTHDLRALTLDNVLHDTVKFLKWLKQSDDRIENAPIIAFGGSYGGFLSALLRIHFPGEIFGSLATSLPQRGFQTDPLNEYVFGFMEWNDMVYYDVSVEATAKIKSAMNDLRACLAAGKFQGMKEQLNLCYGPNSTEQNYDLLNWIAGAYLQNLQYNLGIYDYPFYKTINATLETDNPMVMHGAAVKYFNEWNGVNCSDWLPNNTAVDPYGYMRCTYLPHFDQYAAPSSIWGPLLPDYTQKHLLDPMCTAAYGFQCVDGGEQFIRRIGLDTETVQSTDRLLLVENLMDPTTYIGMEFFYPGNQRNNSRVMLVDGSSHGADLLVSMESDSEGLKRARSAQLNTFKEWLGMGA
ncbi:hypothetical protein NA57DRAFT_73210 [Rhizodiscina lignyota]|uniref:Uncharacterized protein n=1 Tax=Rhizodiscina lignyota TaxID=1504668 RepID=A0A9P4M958_9PEZI|nr:hypothetical protein NA57DRAFT_73210 [Rhizodiscina lignyota]